MGYIQENAADCVRDMLREFSTAQGLSEVGTVYGEDKMDDGSIIKLSVTIDREKGTAAFDFSGTGASHFFVSHQYRELGLFYDNQHYKICSISTASLKMTTDPYFHSEWNFSSTFYTLAHGQYCSYSQGILACG